MKSLTYRTLFSLACGLLAIGCGDEEENAKQTDTSAGDSGTDTAEDAGHGDTAEDTGQSDTAEDTGGQVNPCNPDGLDQPPI
ncbi:MAG: hypothetical protein ACJAYU_003702 [Bradymonadia bacterium]|jgi:hypothetical protein